MKKAITPETYVASNPQWKSELEKLRSILLSAGLEETIKWGAPVYTFDNKNIVGLAAFQSYVGLWFFQGVFLKDPQKVLVNAQEGKTKGLRQWRFSSAEEIEEQTVLTYVAEAIQNHKEGKEVKPATNKALIMPEELLTCFLTNNSIKEAFDKFTPGKKREFANYINEAKRAETKQKRLEKVIPMILAGKGLNDKYK